MLVKTGRAAVMLGSLLAASLAVPAQAASAPRTRLVSCGTGNCLLVTGRRENAAAQVLINGHPLDVQGGRRWQVRVPVATIREWSAPFARRIEVSTRAPSSKQDSSDHAVLPIGLLGHVPDLASLIITVH